jgi:hypothetical protein
LVRSTYLVVCGLCTRTKYVYDALGRRRAKFVGGVGTGYLSANDQEIAEYSASFALLRRYIPGAGLDEPVARVDGNGTVNYLHTDGLGSVISESSGSPGAIIIGSNYAYGPFGESATVAGGFIRYTGRRLDLETGLEPIPKNRSSKSEIIPTNCCVSSRRHDNENANWADTKLCFDIRRLGRLCHRTKGYPAVANRRIS